VLNFLIGPVASRRLKLRIVVEDLAEIGCVVAAVKLDHRRGLDDPDHLRIDLRWVEPIPRDIGKGPRFHAFIRDLSGSPDT
jgi:hypothetical protein